MYQHKRKSCVSWTVVETQQSVPIIHHNRSSVTWRSTAKNPLLRFEQTPVPEADTKVLSGFCPSILEVNRRVSFTAVTVGHHRNTTVKTLAAQEGKRRKHKEIATTDNKTILDEQHAETILGPEEARNMGTQHLFFISQRHSPRSERTLRPSDGALKEHQANRHLHPAPTDRPLGRRQKKARTQPNPQLASGQHCYRLTSDLKKKWGEVW